MPLRKARTGEEPLLRSLADREPHFNLLLLSNLECGLSPDVEGWLAEAR